MAIHLIRSRLVGFLLAVIFPAVLFPSVLAISRPAVAAIPLAQWTKRPKLAVVIVIDQCRSDFLTRYGKKLMSSKSGGLKMLMEKGAYFPFARYDILQSMTCPGHATVLTGAYPYQMGIPLNDWYDTEKKSEVYCASDSSSPIVGRDASSDKNPDAKPEDGMSPRRLEATTVGDELKTAGLGTKVVGIALKDRSAIMLGGHRADLALWIDSGQWVTSKYYRPDGTLPEWVTPLNVTLKKDRPDEKAFSTPFGVKATTFAAIEALRKMQLGKSNGTDILAVSYSSHDMLGHEVGLQSPKMEEMTLAENESIGELISVISKEVGLQNVVFAFTGDHGVAPPVDVFKPLGLPAGYLENKVILNELNQHLDLKWGKSEKGNWILKARSWNFYLNPGVMADRKRDRSEVEAEVKARILAGPVPGGQREGVKFVFTRTEYENQKLPPGQFERQIKKTYIVGKSGDVVIIPKPYWVEKGPFATHMTGYNYDAAVPLVFMGPGIKPGVYAEKAEVVDLAPTLSFLLGTVAPSGSEGRVLHEMFP